MLAWTDPRLRGDDGIGIFGRVIECAGFDPSELPMLNINDVIAKLGRSPEDCIEIVRAFAEDNLGLKRVKYRDGDFGGRLRLWGF